MFSKCFKLMSALKSLYLLPDKKKSAKRIKIVPQLQQQKHNPKKQKVSETNSNGSSVHKMEKVEKKPVLVKAKGSSIEDGKKMFEWLINPEPVDKFMRYRTFCCVLYSFFIFS